MRMKKCLSILLAVVMIATMITSLPITANAVEIEAATTADDNVIPVDSAEALAEACDTINTNGGTYTIDLTESFEGQVKITNEDAVVTVISSTGHTLTATRSSAVYVSGGATVNLGDGKTELTLSGKKDGFPHTANDEPGLIYILPGSTCNMDKKVTLKDRTGNNYFGGGVTVQGGTFIMNGGTIQDCGIDGGSVCYGGGVAVFNGGNFIMENGTITDCYATSDYPVEDYSRQYAAMGGGVFVTADSTFTMNGGTISNCRATNFGGGVAVVTHTKLYNGKLTSKAMINSGVISGNTSLGGAGVFASGFVYAYAIPIATGAETNSIASTGYSNATSAMLGAAPSDPGLYIKGGTITDNNAIGTYSTDNENSGYLFAKGLGGGILTYGINAPVQIHDATISSNNADHGAGIASYYSWTHPDIENCTITDNTAKRNGGGVALINNSANAELKNTTITGNKSGDRGAGVYYDAKSKLYISGADTIQNNKYNEKLNNLNALSVDYPVYVNGALTGSQIGLSDPALWDDGKEDAATDAVSADKLTSGYKANNLDVHPDQYFTSDHETWFVDRTKAEEKEVDDTSISYRQYTAKRYPVFSGDNPAGQSGYVRFESQKQDAGKISSLQDIFNELVYHYGLKYSENTASTNTNKSYSASDGTTITIQLSSYLVTLEISRNQTSVKYYGNPNYQKNAENGVIYLYLTNTGDISNYTFSPDPDKELATVKYCSLTTPRDNYIYEYDDLGKITAKLELVGGRYNYTTVYGKKIATVGDDNEVRLVRKETVDYHINNDYIAASNDNQDGTDKDIFTDEITKAGTTVKVGETINKFYTVPEVVSTATNTCPYIFKGWYYDQNNEDDSRPVHFDTDTYTAGHDIYAHWIKVDNVDKDSTDEYILPNGNTYGGFDLAGVQIREGVIDTNFDSVKKPGGMRFITSLSKKVVSEINKLKSGGNNIEYGYVTASATNEGWIKYHDHYQRKLQYVSDSANGIDTSSSKAPDETYFGFAKNVNCTSKESNSSSEEFVKEDHRSYDGYLLYTLVVTYEGATEADKAKNVLARPYIHYTDANGLERVAYSDYNGNRNKLGGCYISYKDVK